MSAMKATLQQKRAARTQAATATPVDPATRLFRPKPVAAPEKILFRLRHASHGVDHLPQLRRSSKS